MDSQSAPASGLFGDLTAFVAAPRVAGLVMSPDGERLVLTRTTLDAEGSAYVGALWEVDPAGLEPARRLTFGAKGESGAAFTPAGDLLFTAARPGGPPTAAEVTDGDAADAARSADDEDVPALWLLPRAGGEARLLARRPGGVGGLRVATAAGTLVLGSATLPASGSEADERAAVRARKKAKVSGVLHDGYPVRYWDHDLGPARTRLFVAAGPGTAGPDTAGPDTAGPDADGPDTDGTRPASLRDLTGHVGRAIGDEGDWDVSADGRTVVTTWVVAEEAASERTTLVRLDVGSGERTVLLDTRGQEYDHPRISPDGTQVAALRFTMPTADEPPDSHVVVMPLAGGEERVLGGGWDRWPTSLRWTPDGSTLVLVADSDGGAPVFALDVDSDDVRQVTTDRGAYSDVWVSPDGTGVYALRSAVDAPAAPVRIPLAGGPAQPLRVPDAVPEVPGSLTDVTATGEDGTPVRGWLALPAGATAAGPAPLLVFIHGGPLGSWNAWTWRWNPWPATARGYAVLLPDPALSTGYGRDFVARGWGCWGEAPYTDILALTDAAEARDDVDETRTAALGGSFGGYMANWVAGHTDRFRAVVTHASLWALDQFGPTTDAAYYWQREMSPQMSAANSPHAALENIVTPMLVVHGDRDYRVPIGEALRLWYELVRRSADSHGRTPHRFLYFPDENHWVLKPNNSRLWYATVLAFVDQHVLGREWQQPDLLP